jgi:hypothetical protein
MVDAAREALGYAAGSSRADLESNPLLVRALSKPSKAGKRATVSPF